MSVQSRGGLPVIEAQGFVQAELQAFAVVKVRYKRPNLPYHGPERPTESNHEPGSFAASVNRPSVNRHFRGVADGIARVRSILCPIRHRRQTGQGLVRNQLDRGSRAWRLLPGGRRRHLQEIWT